MKIEMAIDYPILPDALAAIVGGEVTVTVGGRDPVQAVVDAVTIDSGRFVVEMDIRNGE